MQKKNWFKALEKERLKRNLSLSLKEKLKLLEEMREFTKKLMPEKNKKIWRKLKEEGW